MDFATEKEFYLRMSLEAKRAQYFCKAKYRTLDQIPTWKEQSSKLESCPSPEFEKNEQLNEKVSLFLYDITALEIDAIVNATDNVMSGGGGVDAQIHRGAGLYLSAECASLKVCQTGEAKITGGYKLPAKYVIHAVGPIALNFEVPFRTKLLEKCYTNSLSVAKEYGLRTIAFPCISTGTHHYTNDCAAPVALKAVRKFLEENESFVDRVIFCVISSADKEMYEHYMKIYFPF